MTIGGAYHTHWCEGCKQLKVKPGALRDCICNVNDREDFDKCDHHNERMA